MDQFFIWLLITVLFIGSFIGLIFPILPSSLLIWIGFFVYHFFIDKAQLGAIFWISMVVLTIILLVSDIIANSYFVKRFGGSKWGERAAAIGVIVGSFIMPPLGILIIPFIAVIFIELIQKKSPEKAMLAATGSLIGFLGGTIAKIIIQLIMIIWFIVAVII